MAHDLRLALWHAPFSRDGPGVLLRDLHKGDPSLTAMANALRGADADIIVLTKIDYDAREAALTALRDLIGDGHTYLIALPANSGIPSGIDSDGDGRLGEPEDAQGFGAFPGYGALAVLSRYPISRQEARSFNDLLWKDLPGSQMTPADKGWDRQRLSSGGHWVVPVDIPPDVRLGLLIGHAGPPVFDGPEDRNGRRNHDELRLWEQIIADDLNDAMPVFMANTNLDPDRGEGNRPALAAFISDGPFQDALPHIPTALWDDPGPMRVSYLLPSAALSVVDAKVWPPIPDQDHRLITVDIDLPDLR
ncbi:endonuclease/exonuclease/phosphatase family protein [Marivita sp. S0852]|uniref:endonuclease/exonuclease/phosphatase family protein n=1 Tax=Marivita sp. S0852 TaxID=3373893 RepID=UPI0039829C7F